MVFTGAYLHLSEGGCESINLNLTWPETGDTYFIKGDPAATCYEEEEIMLNVTVSATKPGLLKITAKPESNRPVWLTMNRVDKNSWKKGGIQVYYHSIVNQLESTSNPVWIKAKKDQDGLTLHCIIVEAFFLNEDCSVTKCAYIDVEKGTIPTHDSTVEEGLSVYSWFPLFVFSPQQKTSVGIRPEYPEFYS